MLHLEVESLEASDGRLHRARGEHEQPPLLLGAELLKHHLSRVRQSARALFQLHTHDRKQKERHEVYVYVWEYVGGAMPARRRARRGAARGSRRRKRPRGAAL